MKTLKNVFFVALMAAVLFSLTSCGKNGVTLSGVNGGGSVELGRDSIGKLKVQKVQLWLNGNVGFGNHNFPIGNDYLGSYSNWYQSYGIQSGIFYVIGPPTNLLKVPIFDKFGNYVGDALCTDAPIYYPNTNVKKYEGKFTQLQLRDYNFYGWAPVFVSWGGHITSNDGKINGEITM